jgi:hypothetical protein
MLSWMHTNAFMGGGFVLKQPLASKQMAPGVLIGMILVV